jgi:hypothetical protein
MLNYDCYFVTYIIMKPETMNVLGSGEVGHQLCWVAKALIGNTLYFLSGLDAQYQKEWAQFTLGRGRKVLGDRLYSPKFILDMTENEPVKIVTVPDRIHGQISYIATQKWFIRIEKWRHAPVHASQWPVPFNEFPEGVTFENFEENIKNHEDKFHLVFQSLLPVHSPSATERPRAWLDGFTKRILEFGVSIDDILVGNKLEVKTWKSTYECVITDTGLEVKNGRLEWTVLSGFVGPRLVGSVSWNTSPVLAIKKI